MRPHIIFRYSGFVFLFNAVFLSISSIISAIHMDTAFFPLLYSTIISILFGVFPFIFVPPTTEITNKEGLLIVLTCWLVSCVIGIIPYLLWGGEFTLTNAWFESVSGFTTTGSTILKDIEALPLGLLFWRASTHWIGGIGIIIFMLSVLPSLGKAGMTLYKSEMSSLAVNNFHYRTRKALQILAVTYVGLTVAEIIGLLLCGMGIFDAVTHSFATIATGGFSTKNLSVAYFRSVPMESIMMVFMVLSGIHFGLLFSAIRGDISYILKSSFVRYYIVALLIGIVLTALNIHGRLFDGWGETFRYASFQVISLGTSTGFATTDTGIWPAFAQLVLIFFTLQCACAGSTSGGIKVDRIVIFFKSLFKRAKQMMHPHAVISPKINGIPLEEDIIEGSIQYIVLYIAIVFISTLFLSFLNLDALTAFSASAATMGNVGPGFGMVSSMSNFSLLPDTGKWILTGTMLLGRLEIFSLILFVMIRSWK